jgi:peptide/nickel transport system permease protein
VSYRTTIPAYLVGRLLAALPVVFVISLLAFGLEAITPGDPAFLLLQAAGRQNITSAEIAAKRAELHLDDPLPVRYLTWVSGAVRGDFGRSFRSYTPVLQLYADRIGNTAVLAGAAILIGMAVAVPLGTLAAYRRGRALDRFAQGIAVFGSAVPGFWIAFVFIFFLSAQWHLLPVFGTLTLKGMLMPAVVLSLSTIAILTRLTRAAVLDTLNQEFVVVARSKGLAGRAIASRHVLPNAMVPVLTLLGLEAASLMTGAAVVEYVFAWPGIGKMAVDAALLRDTPVLVGFAVAAGLIYVIVNLVVDIAVTALDPRTSTR